MILAVAGGKGGVGKSTVALNVGAELDAVVVDADISMADLPSSRGPDLHDVLAGRASPLEAVREDGPVAVLPCGRTLAGARASDPTELVSAVKRVAEAYGDVVIDCPAGMAADAGIPFVAADACLLVTAPGAGALADAVRTRALACELDAGLVCGVLNRVVAESQREAEARAVERALGVSITVVPESRAVSRAQRHGQPVRAVAPDTDPVRRFEAIAGAVQSCRS